MVSMEVSKTLGPGSSPGTPAIDKVKTGFGLVARQTCWSVVQENLSV